MKERAAQVREPSLVACCMDVIEQYNDECDSASYQAARLERLRVGMASSTTPSEVENTLQRLSHHRGVRGVMILSNDTGRVIKHTGSMLEGPPSASEEADSSSNKRSPMPEGVEGTEAVAAGSSGYNTAPMVNATVRKYADAVRRIVTASKEAVHGLDDKVVFLRLVIAYNKVDLIFVSNRTRCAFCGCEQDSMK